MIKIREEGQWQLREEIRAKLKGIIIMSGCNGSGHNHNPCLIITSERIFFFFLNKRIKFIYHLLLI